MSNSILAISGISIKQDSHGRFCLNDLHKASGNEKRHSPNYWLSIQQTKELIDELSNYDTDISVSKVSPVETMKGRGKQQGTFVVKELVYSYAMWISAKFQITVLRAYDAMVNQKPYALKELKPTYASVKMERHVSEMVNLHAVETGKHYNTIYDDIKTKFEFQKIGEIPVLTYPEICAHFGKEPKYDLPKTVTVDILDAGKAEKYQTLLQIERGELNALPSSELEKLRQKPAELDYQTFIKLLGDSTNAGYRLVKKAELYDLGLKMLDMGL